MNETKTRSFAKALSWRILASMITAAIVLALTKESVLAVEVGLADSAIKIGVYFLHERIWLAIPQGRR